jgi:hypothetical protein
MTLGIVYHMPFWRGSDGTLRELEGSFARYVDSLAPYFDEISLCVPVLRNPSGEGTVSRSANVTLAPLPHFDGPLQFYPLASVLPADPVGTPNRCAAACRSGCRLRVRIARLLGRRAFLLVVGDLRAAAFGAVSGQARALARTEFEQNIRWMVNHALTFADRRCGGTPCRSRRGRNDDRRSRGDIEPRGHVQPQAVQALSVGRIDPRKGCRASSCCASARRRGDRRHARYRWTAWGRPGEDSRQRSWTKRAAAASPTGFPGAVPLDRLLPMCGLRPVRAAHAAWRGHSGCCSKP